MLNVYLMENLSVQFEDWPGWIGFSLSIKIVVTLCIHLIMFFQYTFMLFHRYSQEDIV